MKCIVNVVGMALLAWFCALPARAEQADREKPVNVEADSVRIEDGKKLAVYEGRVIFTQGTLRMNAERVEIRGDDAGLYSGIATGSPVQFRQKQEGREEWVEGWANRIEYDARSESIRLVGAARLKKGEDELRGEVIYYDARSELYQAKGAEPGKPAGRVKAVILPRLKQDKSVPAKP